MRWFISIISVLWVCSALAEEANVCVTNHWVRAVPPVSTMTAGYMTIRNHDDTGKRLVSVSTPVAEVVEIHEVFQKDGGSGMRPVKGVTVPARGTVSLEPGGYHLMLINLAEPLEAGQSIELTLEFDDGTSLVVHPTVKRGGGGHRHHH